MKKIVLKYGIIVAILNMIALNLCAQTKENEIKTDQIDIEKIYQPQLANGRKIEFKGALPANDSTPISYDYPILDRVVQIPFTPGTLRPLPLQRHKTVLPQTGFVSAGYGTQYGQYLLAELNKKFSNTDLAGIDLHRLSMSGHKQNQLVNLNDITAYNIYSKNLFINTTTVTGSYNIFHRYGYNADITSVDADRAAIWRGLAEVKDKFQGSLPKSNFTYGGFADFYDYFDKNGINEISGALNGYIDKGIKKRHHIMIDATVDVTNYNNPADTNMLIASIKTGYEYRIQGFITHLGLNFTLLNKDFFVMPDIYSEKNLIRQYIITYAGWRDRFEKNDMRSLTELNPFLEATPPMRYSYVDNSYYGVRGALGQHFSYNLEYDNKLYYTNKRNNYAGMPLFVPSSPDSTQFSIKYDRVSVNSLKVELSFEDLKTFRLTYTLEYNGYSLAEQKYAWNMPAFVTGLDGLYRFNKRTFAEFTLFYLSGVHALTSTIDPATRLPKDVMLRDHLDVNVKIHYTIDNSWNVFLHLTNLTYSTYYRYYNYPSYPIQVLVGAMFKF